MALIGGPLVIVISGWLLFRLTRGSDTTGAKMAARIMGTICLALVSFVGIAGLPANGPGFYTLSLLLFCLVLITPLVISAAIVTSMVALLRDRLNRHTSPN